MSQKNKVEIQVSVIGEEIAAAKIEAMTNAASRMAEQAARAVDLLTLAVELAQTLAQTKIDIAPPCAAKPAKKPAEKKPAPIVRKPVIVEKPTGAKVVKAEIVRKPVATAKPKRVRPPRTDAQKARRRELAALKRAAAAKKAK